jgi:hypothetical protein
MSAPVIARTIYLVGNAHGFWTLELDGEQLASPQYGLGPMLFSDADQAAVQVAVGMEGLTEVWMKKSPEYKRTVTGIDPQEPPQVSMD